jgi:hypothetical protein
MEKVGLVWDVKVPTEERQKIRRAKAPGAHAGGDA